MFRMIIVATAMLALASCGESEPQEKWSTDQGLRAKLFKECLAELPAGPVSTKYNDWDEVVGACADVAYYQSRYCYENCTPARKEGA